MGWSRGSEILRGIVQVIHEEDIEDDIRTSIYEQLIEIFTDNDMDDPEEVGGIDPMMDEVLIEQGYVDPTEGVEDLDEEIDDEEEEE